MSKYSFLSFASEVKEYIFNNNEKFIKWGPDNKFPAKILDLYDSVPEHCSAINFVEQNLSANGIDDFDIWTLKKISLDFILFGGFTILNTKLKNGKSESKYIDIANCRLGPDKKTILYAEDWNKYKVETKSYPIINSINDGTGIFYFKNIKSRKDYPSPYYLSAFKAIDTASMIASYHNNNAKNGFGPNVVLNFNDGIPDEDTKRQMEKDIKDVFTGPNSQKFILSFNNSEESKTTVEKLDNDNLDQKFETLQKFIQNQIIIVHQITSGQLIGVKAENQGFSKTEFSEAMEIFQKYVISGFRNELEYALSTFFDKEVKIKELEEETVNESANNDTNTIEQ